MLHVKYSTRELTEAREESKTTSEDTSDPLSIYGDSILTIKTLCKNPFRKRNVELRYDLCIEVLWTQCIWWTVLFWIFRMNTLRLHTHVHLCVLYLIHYNVVGVSKDQLCLSSCIWKCEAESVKGLWICFILFFTMHLERNWGRRVQNMFKCKMLSDSVGRDKSRVWLQGTFHSR